MRTTKNDFYSAIMIGGALGGPSMKESRRDLDRAFYATRFGALSV